MSYWNVITLWFFIYFLKLFNLLQVINENVAVWDSSGKEVESQLLPLLNVSVTVRKYHVKAYLGKSPKTAPSYWLAFSATVPPLGFSTYIVSSSKRAGQPFDSPSKNSHATLRSLESHYLWCRFMFFSPTWFLQMLLLWDKITSQKAEKMVQYK